MKISAIMLAAGNSSRLGRAKQLLPFQGKSLITHSLDKLHQLELYQKVVVVGAYAEKIKDHLGEDYPDLQVVENKGWLQGMASSLQKGLQVLDAVNDAVLICLADQPLIPVAHLEDMIAKYRVLEQLVISAYNQDIGVPALIPSRYFPELSTLQGQKGAKFLLLKYQSDSSIIPCPSAAFDIDTEEDYRRIVDMI